MKFKPGDRIIIVKSGHQEYWYSKHIGSIHTVVDIDKDYVDIIRVDASNIDRSIDGTFGIKISDCILYKPESYLIDIMYNEIK